MIRLVVLSGPIGSGKSTVAELVARRIARAGRTAVAVDLDDLAFAQRGRQELDELWRRAGVAHTALVRGWFDAGVDVVIAHGPLFESRTYDELLATTTSSVHVVLHVAYDTALARVTADTDRAPTAISRDAAFLRDAYDALAERDDLPPADLEIDTTERTAHDVADQIADAILVGAGDPDR